MEFPSSKYSFQYFSGKGQTVIKLKANQSMLVHEICFYSWDFINKRELLAISPKLNERYFLLSSTHGDKNKS